jgi:DNA polymerase
MAANDEVGRYLRQLREQGESDLTLESPTVAGELRARAASGRKARLSQPAQAPAESDPTTGDWRAVLRAQGAESAVESPKTSAPAPHNDRRLSFPAGADAAPRAADSQGTVTIAPEALPGTGLAVNHPPGDMFSNEPRYQSLDEIVRAVSTCTRCALRTHARNPVPGEGSATAELVCVGEGPGASEDETGRPFVGAAGQLLTQILAAIRLRREDVYICNVVKHRPPNNRTPLPDEVAACKPFLFRQIELIQPKVILALGASAAQTLLDTRLAIGKLRGVIHRFNGVPLIVTYHPAALLRNPAWKRPTWEDVQIARRIMDGGK